jgi:hypothetical protein
MTPRLHSIERVFIVAELLKQDRDLVRTSVVHREVCRRLRQQISERTTRRDLLLLARLGYVEQSGRCWRWIDHKPLLGESPANLAG